MLSINTVEIQKFKNISLMIYEKNYPKRFGLREILISTLKYIFILFFFVISITSMKIDENYSFQLFREYFSFFFF